MLGFVFYLLLSLSNAIAEPSADFTGGYNWGSYSSPGHTTDTHAGAAVHLYAGYRFLSDFDAGITASYAFPQISILSAPEAASFTYRSIGFQFGYFAHPRVEPFLTFHPFAQLSQSTKTVFNTTPIQTELRYDGMAYGGGTKLYLTNRNSEAVQIGLRFLFIREHYNSSVITTRADAGDHAFSPKSKEKFGDALVTGNTYQMGMFIGI